jgi:hypothetical protein
LRIPFHGRGKGEVDVEKRDMNQLFHEVQEFRGWVKALLVYPCSFALIAVFGFAMYRQLGRGIPFGREPMPDALLWFLGPCMVLLGLFLILLFTTMRLVTTVRPDGLYIRYVPFVKRKIEFQSIERCEARTYNPIREFGGWGIRRGISGRVYNVKGNRGVQLYLEGRSGRRPTRLMLGSQRADELAEVIGKMMRG